VRLRELGSIAIVVASIAGIKPPIRKARRYYPQLINWYHENWERVVMWFLCVELRDDGGIPINHHREVSDQTLRRILK
jgi:hypothetical protein